MKFHLINIIKISVLLSVFLIVGCSSGEYDIEEYEVNTIEKTLKYDTIKKIVEDKIKDDKTDKIKDDKKDSYTYIVQIGAFYIKSNFERFYERARQIVGQEIYFEVQNNLYKIRLGSFTVRAEAILQLDKVKALGYSDAFIITRKN
ncbi:MAG TPA: SPOR domain-containing protein [Ignavibacteria bacterium]|nr:SPOR domain-containing protein [Ignavibacteria bacterium]